MRTALLLLLSLASSLAVAASGNFLKQIHVEQSGATTLIHFDMTSDLATDQIEARFLRRTIEWDLPAVQLKKDKMFIDVSGAEINNIYASVQDSKGTRIRINLNNEKTASNFHEQVRFVKGKNKMTLALDGSVAVLDHNIKELSRMYDIQSESKTQMEEHIAKQSVLTIDNTDSVKTAMSETKEAMAAGTAAGSESEEMIDDNKDEKEIPLVSKNAKASEAGSSAMGRMIGGVGAVLLLLASVYFVNKKLHAKKAGAAFNHDSITVVSQKYLGPKRTLTLVRVSGEYLLLGVTDHNISLIKQLSVIDDEIPNLVPQDFKSAVRKIESRDSEDSIDTQAQEVEDSFSVSSLNDVRKIFQKRKYIDETDV